VVTILVPKTVTTLEDTMIDFETLNLDPQTLFDKLETSGKSIFFVRFNNSNGRHFAIALAIDANAVWLGDTVIKHLKASKDSTIGINDLIPEINPNVEHRLVSSNGNTLACLTYHPEIKSQGPWIANRYDVKFMPETWPRFYFDLIVAKCEVEAFFKHSHFDLKWLERTL
jgi:hypothetical protein